MDTGEKMGVVAGDGGVEIVKLGGKGLGNVFVLTQDSVSKVNGLEVTVVGKGGSGGRRGSIKRDPTPATIPTARRVPSTSLPNR